MSFLSLISQSRIHVLTIPQVKADRDETPNSEQATAMEEEIEKVKVKKSSSKTKEV